MTHLSVIIPTYKRIDQTLRTIQLLHSSKGWGEEYEAECIIADSTPDASLENKLRTVFPDVIHTRPKVFGIATNKNAGARAAHHQLLLFCDSDMEVEPDTLLQTITTLQAAPTVGMLTGMVVWRGGEHDGDVDRPRPEDRIIDIDNVRYIESIYSRFVITYKDVFNAVGEYDEAVFNRRGEGSDLSVRYWRAGYPLAYNPLILVHHVHNAPDAMAVRVPHAARGIAKDMVLLAHKYSMTDNSYPNFEKTVMANFGPLGRDGVLEMLYGIAGAVPDIAKAHEYFAAHPLPDSPYNFRFLEIFSDQKQVEACIRKANDRLSGAREKVFGKGSA